MGIYSGMATQGSGHGTRQFNFESSLVVVSISAVRQLHRNTRELLMRDLMVRDSKWFVFPLLAGAALATSAARAQTAQPAKRPNIVFMLIDDMGWGELGCYGNTFNETPRIDKFATTAMRFTEAYCQPTCSPTRASLLSGQYPHRTGIEDYLDYNSPNYLDPNKEYTVNKMLSDAGYLTCHIGKWHLDTHFQKPKGNSKQFGFDEVIGTETKYIADGDYFFPFDKIRTLPEVTPHEFLPDRLSDEAVGFIERASARKAPFFLYYAEYAVHADLDAPAELVQKYRRKYDAKYGSGASRKFDNKHHLGKPDNIYMGAMAERVDAGFGKILDALDRLGIAGNTVVILLSDNGGDGRDANNGVLRGAKGQVWEGGIRDPQIVRWPGVTKPGSVCDQPTLTIDYYPTIAEIADTKIPAKQKIDGTSFVPLLQGEPKLSRPAPLFWHYPANTAPWPERAGGACRDGDFKLVEVYQDGHFEMFNIKKDPAETQNLVAAMPEKFAEMQKKFLDWQKSLGIEVPKREGIEAVK
jgi:arylsulfatase A